jgi:hypothetical protein
MGVKRRIEDATAVQCGKAQLFGHN